MKKNQAFTLVELIIVLSVFSVITLFFWQVLNSAVEDSSSLTDKVEVQNSITLLMNAIQKDIQEAVPRSNIEGKKSIFFSDTDDVYIINGTDGLVKYEFIMAGKKVRRVTGLDVSGNEVATSEASEYANVVEFSMEVITNGLGADIRILGGKKGAGEFDKSRQELKSTYYTRNTL